MHVVTLDLMLNITLFLAKNLEAFNSGIAVVAEIVSTLFFNESRALTMIS